MMRTDGSMESTADHGLTNLNFNSNMSKPNPIDIPPGVEPPQNDVKCDCDCHIYGPLFQALYDAAIPTIPCVECRCWDRER